jgi:acetolactate synthase I/III small subunit
VPSQRHIIAITLQNESGALTRVAGLFSTRGYNIESLNVAATDDPTVSRLTLVTTGNDAVIHQITQQSLKLVDVVDVEDVTREDHFERELLLIKVKAKATQVGSLWSATQRAGGRVLWDAADSFTIELTSSEADINRFMAEAANFGEVLEVVRSGALAIQKGRHILES